MSTQSRTPAAPQPVLTVPESAILDTEPPGRIVEKGRRSSTDVSLAIAVGGYVEVREVSPRASRRRLGHFLIDAEAICRPLSRLLGRGAQA